MKRKGNISLNAIAIYCVPAFFLLYSVFYFYFGERAQIFAGGLEYDQLFYGTFAKDFFHHLITYHVDDYHATRLLPSLMVYLGSHFLGYSLSSDNKIFSAFLIYDTLLLTLSIWLWRKISKKSQFPATIFWLGFFSLFINVGNFKCAQFNPIQTDTTAFFFGMLLLYLYVSKKPFLICLMGCIATFAWQICIYFSLFLVMHPPKTNKDGNNILSRNRKFLNRIFPYVALILFFGLVLYYNVINPHLLYSGAYQVIKSQLPITATLAGFCVFYIAKNSDFVNKTLSIDLLSQVRNRNTYYWLLATGCYLLILHWIKVNYGIPLAYGFYQDFWMMFVLSVVKPAISLVSHVVYFGPIFILFIFFIRQVMKTSYEASYGLFCFLILTLAMSLSSESRFLMFNIPVFVYLICKTMSSMRISANFVKFYAVLSLIMSRFYIGTTAYNNFPFQGLLFQITGPWMPWSGYWFNVILVCLSAFLIYIVLRMDRVKVVNMKHSDLQRLEI